MRQIHHQDVDKITIAVNLNMKEILTLVNNLMVQKEGTTCVICKYKAGMSPTRFVMEMQCEGDCVAKKIREAGRQLAKQIAP